MWVTLDLVFYLLHLDLDLDLPQNHLNNAKERKWELESKKSTSCSAPLHQIKGQNILPSKISNIRVLRSKP